MSHKRYCRDVEIFQHKFGLPTPPKFTKLPADLFTFRVNFLNEEFFEYIDAYKKGDFATAIDSLIDLMYVTYGMALLSGVNPDDFAKAVGELDERDKWTPTTIPPSGDLCFLSDNDNNEFIEGLTALIYHCIEKSENHEFDHPRALALIASECYTAMRGMGLSPVVIDAVWDEIQRANISKERALRPSDSKRGSVWDVIKPPGWKAPDPGRVIRDMLGRELPDV